MESLSDRQTGQLEFLSRKDNGALWKGRNKDSRKNSRQFLQKFGQYFGIKNPNRDLELLKEIKDSVGMSHLKYNQKWNGVPVFGGQLTVHLKDSQMVSSVNGKVHSLGQLNTKPKINQKRAARLAKKYWAEKQASEPEQIRKARLYIYNKKFISPQRDDNQNYLVWEINLFSEKPYRHEIIYVNARNGSLVDRREAIKKAVDRRVYNCRAWEDYDDCVLEDTLNNTDHGRSEGIAARGITDIDKLYDYTGSVHNYFVDTFSRTGANKNGGLGNNVTNPYGKTDSYGRIDYDPFRGIYCPTNAFFDDSAFFGGTTINFCDGAATKDIVGHEYTHGVSYFSILDGYGDPSGLIYEYESGALEEADADIFGEAVENYMNGSSDWLSGEDISGGPFRSMSEPGSIIDAGIGGYPPRFNSANFYCDIWDNGGVHHNSTVVSHAAYLMATGGTYNGCAINAIGRAKEEAVFYRAITQYFTTTSGFNEAYTALNAACADLYGVGSDDCINVKKALLSVEMDQGGTCSGLPATTPNCDFTVSPSTIPPTITSVSSSVANGSYKAGSIIDVNVYFSESVTSTGGVTVNLNTGRSCTLDVVGSNRGSCNYVVDPADSVERLDISSISGIIRDADGNAMTNFSPASNLSQNNQISIDNTTPVISGVTEGQIYRNDINPTFSEGRATLNGENFTSGQTISQDGNYSLIVTDNAGNSSTLNFTIEKIASSVTSLPYTAKKANRRISFYVYGLNLPGKLKARGFTVRLSGRRLKVLSVRNAGQYVLINTRQNFRKWPTGDYNFDLQYGYKVKKVWYRGSAAKNNILTVE